MAPRYDTPDALVERAREAWRESFRNFTVFDVLHDRGSPLDALLYAHLFWPRFVVLHGMTFLLASVEDEADERRISEAMRKWNDQTKVEESFNFVEIAALFGRRKGESEAEGDRVLAEVLVETWSAKLQRDFPDKRFRVVLVEATASEEVGVTFYEERT